MTTTNRVDDDRMRARALARWEGEGGALRPTPEPTTIDEPSLHILARLGAALIDSWADIPAPVQARIVRRARTLGAPGDHVVVLEALARFLQEHSSEC